MKLLLTGLNHRTAPVEVRERIAFEEHVSARRARIALKNVPACSKA